MRGTHAHRLPIYDRDRAPAAQQVQRAGQPDRATTEYKNVRILIHAPESLWEAPRNRRAEAVLYCVDREAVRQRHTGFDTPLQRQPKSCAQTVTTARTIFSRVLLALACLHAQPSSALDPSQRFGDYVRDRWGLPEGLPQVSALSIVQDDTGYIWVGTQNGIARFDGMRFISFDRQAAGYPVTMVSHSLRGRDGALWFGSDRGILRFDGTRFHGYQTTPAPLPITALAQTADGSTIAGTTTGIVKVDGARLVPWQLDGEAVGALMTAPGGVLWAGIAGAVVRIDGNATTRFTLPADPPPMVTDLVLAGDRLWIGSSRGLFELDQGASQPPTLVQSVADAAVESLLRDAMGSLWIGTATALIRRTPDGNFTRHAEGEFIANPWVTALFEDRDGSLWIGSQSESLFRLWNGWVTRVTTRDGLTDPLTWSVVLDPAGQLVVGTNSNVMVRTAAGMQVLVDGSVLPNPAAYELNYDRRGRLWIGTRAGLARLDPGSPNPVVIDAVGRPQVNVVIEGDDEQLWLGTSNGLFRWENETAIRVGPSGPAPSSAVRSILPLQGKRALVGTEAGVFIADDGQWSAPEWAKPLAGEFITGIERIEPDMVMVTTLDSGFGVLIDERLAMIGLADGLPNSNVFTTRRAGDTVFLSSANGAFSTTIHSLREHWRAPGATPIDWRVPASICGTLRGSLRTRCCNGGARARAAVDGRRIWYPTLEGALAIDLDRLDVATEVPTVVIESVQRRGQAPTAPGLDPLLVDGASRDLAIGFTALAFRDPTGLRFEYRLEGYDQDWVQAGSRREAFYTNLPPGDYTFHARAESSARQFSERDATFRISVLPFWHERTATRIALLGAIASLIALLVHVVSGWRTRRFEGRQLVLEGIVNQRTEELARANASLRDANQSLAQENQTDALTGLPNRRWMLTHLGEWLQQAVAAHSPAQCCVFLLFDLDHFKRMNERYGHAGGDKLLVQFSQLLARLVGEQGVVVRWGGEEFLLVLRCVDRTQARARADQLWRQALEHIHTAPDGKPMVLTSSVGYSLYPPLPSSPQAVPWTIALELADAAVYQVKQHARNAWAGLLVAPGADSAMLAGSIAGRIGTLLGSGVLAWDNIRPRYGSPLEGRLP